MSNSRRNFLQGAVLAAVPFLTPRSQHAKSVLSDRSEPEFKIGDLVACDWEPDEEDDDVPDSATDFGEIVGVCWIPENGSYYPRHTWVYYVHWTCSTCGPSSFYPHFDGEMTRGSELRLVHHV